VSAVVGAEPSVVVRYDQSERPRSSIATPAIFQFGAILIYLAERWAT
jgi:hypothetical protein